MDKYALICDASAFWQKAAAGSMREFRVSLGLVPTPTEKGDLSDAMPKELLPWTYKYDQVALYATDGMAPVEIGTLAVVMPDPTTFPVKPIQDALVVKEGDCYRAWSESLDRPFDPAAPVSPSAGESSRAPEYRNYLSSFLQWPGPLPDLMDVVAFSGTGKVKDTVKRFVAFPVLKKEDGTAYDRKVEALDADGHIYRCTYDVVSEARIAYCATSDVEEFSGSLDGITLNGQWVAPDSISALPSNWLTRLPGVASEAIHAGEVYLSLLANLKRTEAAVNETPEERDNRERKDALERESVILGNLQIYRDAFMFSLRKAIPMGLENPLEGCSVYDEVRRKIELPDDTLGKLRTFESTLDDVKAWRKFVLNIEPSLASFDVLCDPTAISDANPPMRTAVEEMREMREVLGLFRSPELMSKLLVAQWKEAVKTLPDGEAKFKDFKYDQEFAALDLRQTLGLALIARAEWRKYVSNPNGTIKPSLESLWKTWFGPAGSHKVFSEADVALQAIGVQASILAALFEADWQEFTQGLTFQVGSSVVEDEGNSVGDRLKTLQSQTVGLGFMLRKKGAKNFACLNLVHVEPQGVAQPGADKGERSVLVQPLPLGSHQGVRQNIYAYNDGSLTASLTRSQSADAQSEGETKRWESQTPAIKLFATMHDKTPESKATLAQYPALRFGCAYEVAGFVVRTGNVLPEEIADIHPTLIKQPATALTNVKVLRHLRHVAVGVPTAQVKAGRLFTAQDGVHPIGRELDAGRKGEIPVGRGDSALALLYKNKLGEREAKSVGFEIECPATDYHTWAHWTANELDEGSEMERAKYREERAAVHQRYLTSLEKVGSSTASSSVDPKAFITHDPCVLGLAFFARIITPNSGSTGVDLSKPLTYVGKVAFGNRDKGLRPPLNLTVQMVELLPGGGSFLFDEATSTLQVVEGALIEFTARPYMRPDLRTRFIGKLSDIARETARLLVFDRGWTVLVEAATTFTLTGKQVSDSFKPSLKGRHVSINLLSSVPFRNLIRTVKVCHHRWRPTGQPHGSLQGVDMDTLGKRDREEFFVDFNAPRMVDVDTSYVTLPDGDSVEVWQESLNSDPRSHYYRFQCILGGRYAGLGGVYDQPCSSWGGGTTDLSMLTNDADFRRLFVPCELQPVPRPALAYILPLTAKVDRGLITTGEEDNVQSHACLAILREPPYQTGLAESIEAHVHMGFSAFVELDVTVEVGGKKETGRKLIGDLKLLFEEANTALFAVWIRGNLSALKDVVKACDIENEEQRRQVARKVLLRLNEIVTDACSMPIPGIEKILPGEMELEPRDVILSCRKRLALEANMPGAFLKAPFIGDAGLLRSMGMDPTIELTGLKGGPADIHVSPEIGHSFDSRGADKGFISTSNIITLKIPGAEDRDWFFAKILLRRVLQTPKGCTTPISSASEVAEPRWVQFVTPSTEVKPLTGALSKTAGKITIRNLPSKDLKRFRSWILVTRLIDAIGEKEEVFVNLYGLEVLANRGVFEPLFTNPSGNTKNLLFRVLDLEVIEGEFSERLDGGPEENAWSQLFPQAGSSRSEPTARIVGLSSRKELSIAT